ncbi:hypothetical protein V8G54_029322 [Vigna mungo]|uniref:Uncharacterized protein n=1 Tax=Vigna mungo TaxID=3915 RepID=A0AAQ3MU39_VIGMU
MLRKQAAGRINETNIVSKDPVNDITKPKKGTERPTASVESTRAVLMSLEYMLKLGWFGGINSSKHIATGDRLNAYLVNGLTTVVHTAILAATKCWGMSRVN